ncbi:3-dehydroshikimate dehydratase [Zopfia rhizophila CBS 207.26]|uniref:3-dehydroshikimate dehydratase n=1 Tax=Zopfia rhizophila CBS 207.26 TaxID=1314779 RepID=A0A6A6EI81_9PEZI|nr:3-dehydroshikimate dehydratase [Zopfia rhizophila CBS 207.26]
MPCKPGISSMSLGRCYANHILSHKLAMASKYSLAGIEIFYEDLSDLARPPTRSNLLAAARYIRTLCSSLSLSIICLQPFTHYEGLLDRSKHLERIEEMRLWIEIALELGTDLIQVPSSFLPAEQISGDVDLIVSDFLELSDLGFQHDPPMRFAYESLAWGTHINKWEQCWDIVRRVDRSNVGICLDSFNILGRIYADPASPTGCTPHAEQEVRESMARLVKEIKPHKEKIFFIQIVGAERLDEPLREEHRFWNEEQPARMSWSRNCRLFYGEEDRGAYLPVKDVAKAIIKDVGYEGWVSFELYNRDMERRNEGVVEELASRAARGWEKMVEDLDIEVERRPELRRKGSTSKDRLSQDYSSREAVEVARL